MDTVHSPTLVVHERDVERVVDQIRPLRGGHQPANFDRGGVHHVDPSGDDRFAGRVG